MPIANLPPSKPTPRKILLTIVDDWEKQERYEERLAPYFELLGAPFGDYGVNLAREHQPDLILVDLVLEDMTEQEAWVLLQSDERTRDIPTVYVTVPGHSWPEGTRILERPYAPERLIELLHS